MGRLPAGVWDWDLNTNTVQADLGLAQMFSLEVSQCAAGIERGQIIAKVHDEDNARLEATLRERLFSDLGYSATFRVRRPEGGYRWLCCQAHKIAGGNGRGARILGRNIDLGAVVDARFASFDAADIAADILLSAREVILPLRDMVLEHVVDAAILHLTGYEAQENPRLSDLAGSNIGPPH